MLALSNVQAWVAPVLQDASSLDLSHIQMWFTPAFQKAVLVDKTHVKASTVDFDHVKAWLALKLDGAPSGDTRHIREIARIMIEKSVLSISRFIVCMESAFERPTMGFMICGILITVGCSTSLALTAYTI